MPRRTPDAAPALSFPRTGLSPSAAGFPKAVPLPLLGRACAAPYPGMPGIPVWAPPVPLAATPGIDVSFPSSGYLDVSVRRVPFLRPMHSGADARVFPARVPPFRHPRIPGHLPLPAAFRSLSRLSSAPSAKASAPCPFLLDHAVPFPSTPSSGVPGFPVFLLLHCFRRFIVPDVSGISFMVFSASLSALYGIFKVHPAGFFPAFPPLPCCPSFPVPFFLPFLFPVPSLSSVPSA